ncbi:MAG: hypothetical protein ACXAB7_08015 [Candidatus Kariarchaeaceae archaeon]|jgi:hypothetical protein
MRVKLIIHQSLRIQGHDHVDEGDFEKSSVLEAIESLLRHSPELTETCLKSGDRRPGLLYLSGKTELASLGLLNTNVDEWNHLEIRIIPILHGG